jgi:hypothetical protein
LLLNDQTYAIRHRGGRLCRLARIRRSQAGVHHSSNTSDGRRAHAFAAATRALAQQTQRQLNRLRESLKRHGVGVRGVCTEIAVSCQCWNARRTSCSVELSRMHARTFTRESMSTSDAWTCRWAAPHSKTFRRGPVRCPATALTVAPAACRTPQQTGSERRRHACSPVSCTLMLLRRPLQTNIGRSSRAASPSILWHTYGDAKSVLSCLPHAPPWSHRRPAVPPST